MPYYLNEDTRKTTWTHPAGKAHLHGFAAVIAAKGLQAHPPRPMALLAQPVCKRWQKPVEPCLYILGEADRFGQGEAAGKMQGRPGGGDRFWRCAEGLIEAHHQVFAEAPGQSGPRLSGQVIDPAQPQARQLCHRILGQTQGGNRQGGQGLACLPRRCQNPKAAIAPIPGGWQMRRCGTAPLPVAPFRSPGACRIGLHVDGIA